MERTTEKIEWAPRGGKPYSQVGSSISGAGIVTKRLNLGSRRKQNTEEWLWDSEPLIHGNHCLKVPLKNARIEENLPQDVAFTIKVEIYRDILSGIALSLDKPQSRASMKLAQLGRQHPPERQEKLDNLQPWMELPSQPETASQRYQRMFLRTLKGTPVLVRQNKFYSNFFLDTALRAYVQEMCLSPEVDIAKGFS